MAAAVARAPALPSRSATPPPQLTLNTSTRGTPAAIPNKHIPICSPGPTPTGLVTPPASPPTKDLVIETHSLLYPPSGFHRLNDELGLYEISAAQLAEALEHSARQALPDPKLVFPWLHGLHADNHIQLAFFTARRRSQRKTPKCLRSITMVKAGSDLSVSRLKGTIAPEELLSLHHSNAACEFMQSDPRDGFSVRNFQIQACKMATVSDIVVYGDDITPQEEVWNLAARIAAAQKAWRQRRDSHAGEHPVEFSTFVVLEPFSTFEKHHPDIVAIDSTGNMTGKVMDFFFWERLEMHTMSRATEISHNVFLGPTPDAALDPTNDAESFFDVMIETSDLAQIPDTRTLRTFRKLIEYSDHATLRIEFPSSGSIMPPTWSQVEVDGLMEVCRWIYGITNPDLQKSGDKDADGDSVMVSADSLQPQKVFIHCTDGYTESSLLALTYFMYAEGLPVHEAWVKLHKDKSRNFFAYPSDVALLTAIQPRILQESPVFKGNVLTLKEPQWISRIDGSLPSRILPYMYLGNLGHANNPELLRELGITRILSVGEPLSWSEETLESWPQDKLLYLDRVQDNGVDALTGEFERCLKFIEEGKSSGQATLVHCRVGVSRSATICIAEVMSELGLSFPRAYCFVRARRLNVIIQPHLRFTYELLKWEERQRVRRGEPLRRDLEWATVAREIAAMNKPYSRQ